jgi:hypothetical protein
VGEPNLGRSECCSIHCIKIDWIFESDLPNSPNAFAALERISEFLSMIKSNNRNSSNFPIHTLKEAVRTAQQQPGKL